MDKNIIGQDENGKYTDEGYIDKLVRYIEEHTLRLEASRRGGGIEIDATEFLKIDGAKMTAYQNYLGGGLLGAIQSDRNFTVASDKQAKDARELEEALKRYFHNITNHEDDEWEAATYEQNQARPTSAY